MNIYSIAFDVENYRLLVPKRETDLDGGNLWINGTLKAESWQAPPMRYAAQQSNEGYADISQITPGFFAFNEKAVNALFEILKTNGELLELVVDGEILYAFNPQNEIDCFNADASEWNTRRNGTRGRLIRSAFDNSKLDGVTIFQVPEHLQNAFYVTDNFKEAYNKAGLSGLIFDKCLSI